jgi:pantoate--beta-alanine ligase
MQEFSSITTLRASLRERGTRTLGFVPTMGNLHAGHLALVAEAKRRNALVAASIFVNPLQFGPSEDLDAYPRTLEADRKALQAAGCDALFLPSAEELYGATPDTCTRVHVPELGTHFCGASRPGHFDGVATVVTKLFNIVQPDDAYFGLKDYQQYLIIRKLTADLALPIEIHGIATQREDSGLALSSRNGYLSSQEKAVAPVLYATLKQLARKLEAGVKDFASLEGEARAALEAAGLRTDYFGIANAHTLAPATASDRELVLVAAAFLGTTRLIDNLRVSL